MRAGGAGGAGGDVPEVLPVPLIWPSPSATARRVAAPENKLIMSPRAGASLNKSPREAELLDQWDVSATGLSDMMDGLINHVFSIDSFKS